MNESIDAKTQHIEIDAHRPDAGILCEILDASSDACWCMEFGIPVDLTAPDREVIRQVFENDPYWSFVNPAMARLYLLEPGVDFTTRPVADIFPRNAQNERFVQTLIDNGFEMDAGPALDTRYDGVQIYVENDVRAHIENGRLLRMFGIVRDVGKHRRRQELIEGELNDALEILLALPTGVVAFDEVGAVTAANPAAAQLLGLSVDALLGGALRSESGFGPLLEAVKTVLRGAAAPAVKLDGADLHIAPSPAGGAVVSLVPSTSGSET